MYNGKIKDKLTEGWRKEVKESVQSKLLVLNPNIYTQY